MVDIRFADFKSVGTGYHTTPDVAMAPYSVSVVLKAVSEVKVLWIDDHSLELRYKNKHSLRA